MGLLEVEQIHKSFSGFMALSGVSLSVEEGSFHALVGPNGAGKSTLFNVITGRYRPDRGRVRFRGQDITGFATHRIIPQGIGISFQRANPFTSMTVLENVTLALLALRGSVNNLIAPLFSNIEATWEAEKILGWVGLEDALDRPVSELPQGDLKRVDIAIALAGNPKLLLLDEPLAGLSRAERAQMVRFIQKLLRELGVTLLFTEHDTESVLRLADRITVLHQGSVLAEGTPEEIRRHPEVVAAFLGGEA